MTCGSEGTGKGLAWACCQAFVQSISSCSRLLSSYYLHWNLSWVTLRSRAGRGGSFPVPKEQICYVVVAYSESWGQVIMTVPFYFFLFSFFNFSKGQGPESGVFSLSHHGGCIVRNNTMLRRNSEYLFCLSLDCICCYRSLSYVIWKQQSMNVMSLLVWSPPSSGFPCFFCISFPDLRVCPERWNKTCCDPAALGAVHRKNPVLTTGTPCSCDAAGDDGTVSPGPIVILWMGGCRGS